MAADNSGFVAAPYTATWDTKALGFTEQGFQFSPIYARDDVRVDSFGDCLVDGIYRGYNLRLTFDLMEWNSAARESLANPFDAAGVGTLDGIGKTLRHFAKQLILTPKSGINSLAKIYTFPLAIPDTDHGAFAFQTRSRRLRCNLIVLPDLTTGKLFAIT